MKEQIRQHYLNQMGVSVWYSRVELPGAALSPDFDFGQALVLNGGDVVDSGVSSDVGSDVGSVSSPEKKRVDVKSAASILSELKVQPVVPAVDASLNRTETPKQDIEVKRKDPPANGSERVDALKNVESQKRPPYSASNLKALELTFYIGKHSWFLVDNDAEFPDVLKQQLLLNIAKALGEDSNNAQLLSFSWPFFGNSQLPGNDIESMMQLLLEWLDQQIDSDGLNGFLMGEKLTQLLLHKNVEQCVGKRLDLNLSDERGVAVVPLLSLNDLLREPLNKQSTWLHVKPYRK